MAYEAFMHYYASGTSQENIFHGPPRVPEPGAWSDADAMVYGNQNQIAGLAVDYSLHP
jgi:hypothetical protein